MIAARFGRIETRRRAARFLVGLLADQPRKNCRSPGQAPPTGAPKAGVPADIEFLTKPALATGMICRALNAGVPARWIAGDEVYGADPALRDELEIRRVGYVPAIGCDRRVPTAFGLIRADTLTASLPKRAWQRLSAGAGAKGERYYDWALFTLRVRGSPDYDVTSAQHW
ncbi:transposase [Streptomyces sp. NPDC050287]|uniref:transposase n=1 Tax=Streptomyces sp. NPDC050287 TaxID=3365608 RepID=UPI0037B5985E